MEILKTYKNFNLGGESIQTLVNMKQQILDLGNLVSQEQMREADAIINETAELQNQQDQWDESLKKESEYIAQVKQLDSIEFSKKIDMRQKEITNLYIFLYIFRPSFALRSSYFKYINTIRSNKKRYKKQLCLLGFG